MIEMMHDMSRLLDVNGVIQLVQCQSKGRYVIAKQFIPAGTILFQDKSVISIDLSGMDASIYTQLESIANDNYYDVTRLIQVYNIIINNQQQSIIQHFNTVKYSDANNMFEHIRRSVSEHLHNKVLTADQQSLIAPVQLTAILNILDTNCHELIVPYDSSKSQLHVANNNMSTDGLFPLLAMFNHSCIENCAFTAINDHTVSVSTINDINVGDEITVNYIDSYYPNKLRRSYLSSVYGFQCNCECCTELIIDKSRAFNCINCNNGIVYQIYNQYICNSQSCQTVHNSSTVELYELAERSAVDITHVNDNMSIQVDMNDGEQINIDDIAVLLNSINEPIDRDINIHSSTSQLYRLLHPSHYSLHYAMELVGNEMFMCERYNGSISMCWMRIGNISLLYGTQHVHWRQAVEYDKLAQLYICRNDIDNAILAYQHVYNINNKCFGDVPATQIAYRRSQQPPTTITELADEYKLQLNQID